MANIISVRGFTPEIDPSCWLADDADIIGRVHIGPDCSIWFKSVIRGDVCKISIGKRCNIQDGAIIHGTYNKSETILKDRVSVGHGAILHGCHIESDVLVGMRSVIMDNAHVESNVIVAAGAVVLENQDLKSGYIYGGTPAKILKEIDPEKTQFHITRTADAYMMYAGWFKEEQP
jgi:carbonic anhydrase/acetyltransferase-like protein (isoleucine patch superfamily)